ncbi:MAG TPA: STAS domain-containing protein [Solirubrobacteraceae bacterium]|nr:STAS domain-containing protein [Solirubrobacteraceae bacterium]
MLPPSFACSWTTIAGDAAWMHVAGELDIATTPSLELTLSEAEAQLVVLDLREVEFMDGERADGTRDDVGPDRASVAGRDGVDRGGGAGDRMGRHHPPQS